MCTRKKCFEDIRFSENSDLSILFQHVAEWLETHDIEFNGRRLHGLISRNRCSSRGSFSNLSQNLTPEAFVSLSIIHLASHRERPINTFANKKNAHSLSKWVVIHEVTSRSFTHTHTHKKSIGNVCTELHITDLCVSIRPKITAQLKQPVSTIHKTKMSKTAQTKYTFLAEIHKSQQLAHQAKKFNIIN